MANPMDKYLVEVKEFTEGSVVKGTIIDVRQNEVLVDIGYKSEGLIPKYEFMEPESLAVGTEIEVLLEKIEDDEGMVVLSHEKAEQKKNWDHIVTVCQEGGIIEGKVRSKVKGGLTVNIGVEAFLPASQIDVVPPRNLDDYVGKTFKFKVVKINQERKNIVLSRRELIEHERDDKRRSLLGGMKVGETRVGVVKNLTDFGAFIDLDGLDGLLHITDMSWGRINHPSEMVKVGEKLEVMILEIDREKERVSLGLKQKNRNPWDDIAAKFPVGSKVHGKVVSVANFGAFVEVEEGIDGMIHISDMSWMRKVTNPAEVLKKGQVVEAMVLEVDAANQRMSLGMKQLETDPWREIDKHYRMGDLVKGKVIKLATFGAFIELPDKLEGLVHISQISEERIDKIKDKLKVGDEVTARVIKIDPQERRIGLSIKAANYSADQLEAEKRMFEDALKPGEAIVDLEHAFDQAQDEKNQ